MTWRWWRSGTQNYRDVHAGQVVETGDAHAIFHAPRHPYTQALPSALPEFAPGQKNVWRRCQVSFPASTTARTAAAVTRCPYATDKCRAEEPALNMLADGRQSKCHYPLDDAGEADTL